MIFRSLFVEVNLSPEQIQDTLRWFPQPYLSSGLSAVDADLKEQANFDDPRIEMFIACFNLSSDRSGVLSLLYDRTLFTTSEAKRIRNRLGWIPTCDAYKIGKADFLLGAPPNFNLEVYEQRIVANLIIRVIHTETGKTPEGEWSHAATVYEDGGWHIPVDWAREIKDGTKGKLTIHVYRHQGRSDGDDAKAVREDIIKEVLGWILMKKRRGPKVMLPRLPVRQSICGCFDEEQMNALASNLPDLVRA
jgi:hypothetical protein